MPSKQKKSPIAQWVSAAIDHSQMGQAELARRLAEHLGDSFDRSKVNKIVLDRRKVSAAEMLAIELITGLPAPASIRPSPRASAPEIARVPLLDSVAAGRLAAPMSQIPMERVPLLAFADLGRGEFFALRVEGTSMDRQSPEGSIIVVNRADKTLISGKSYVFNFQGETTYKLWQGGDPPYLDPFTTEPIHKPIFVKKKRDMEVIGRVKRTVLDL